MLRPKKLNLKTNKFETEEYFEIFWNSDTRDLSIQDTA